jgi:hypothetical protein
MMEWYYQSGTDAALRVTVYGPFTTEREASHAAYFNRPVAVRDADMFMATRRGVCQFEADELAAFVEEPQAYGYSVVRRAAKAPLHRSWRAFTVDFREGLFDRDRGEA